MVGVQQIDRVVEVVEETLKGIQCSTFITLRLVYIVGLSIIIKLFMALSDI